MRQAQMKEYKKQLMSAIKDGNSKKIREARKGYMQAMDDSTFGGSKASKASAERDYQTIVKALSKAGYNEQGYKKRSVGTGTNDQKPIVKRRMSDAFIARYHVEPEKPKHKVHRSRVHIDNSQEQALYEAALKSRRRKK